jgi:hypothetical protein
MSGLATELFPRKRSRPKIYQNYLKKTVDYLKKISYYHIVNPENSETVEHVRLYVRCSMFDVRCSMTTRDHHSRVGSARWLQ